MAPTETYVDPAIAADSGAGTIGDPYGDLQYALDTMTRDSTNGDRINIKAGTDEVLAASLDLTTYGSPSESAPLILQGYTSTAGDGGVGGVDMDASYTMWASTAYDFITLKNLHCHNAGSNIVVHLDRDCKVENCEIDNSTSHGLDISTGGLVLNCHIHNIGGVGVLTFSGSLVMFCTVENGVNDCTTAIGVNGDYSLAFFNIVNIDGSSNGLSSSGLKAVYFGNSIFSNGGTGKGISMSNSRQDHIILNNIIEGFSGAGGVGIYIPSGHGAMFKGHNAFYNNTTDENIAGTVFIDLGNDQFLGASPFTDAANGDFTISTALKALGYPTANYPGLSVRSYLDIGALQREEAGAGGGGLLTHLGMLGGIRG